MCEVKLKMSGKYKDEESYRWYIPKRYIVAALGFLGMFNVYAMRVNLSVAMVAMVNHTKAPNETLAFAECANLIREEKGTEGYKGEQYNWDMKTQGYILGSFFYGYIATQLPGGTISEKFGAKWLFACGILVTAVFSLLTPLAASLGTAVFITVRVLEGLGEGVTFPAINVVISRWAPSVERSRLSTVIFTGAQIGNVIALPVSGWLSSSDILGGWPSVFYVFGTIGCVWFVFWSVFVYEQPADNPAISKEELLYIQLNKEDKQNKSPSSIPWKCIFTSLPMWAVIVAHFGHNFGFLILLTEMPTYLSTILHFNLKENGALSAVPYIVQAMTAWAASFVADWLRKTNKFTNTTIRKVCNSVGLFGPAVCLLGITFSGCQPKVIVALLSLAMALNGFIYSGFNITHVDMSPDLAGTLFGITNAISNFCGIIGPAVVGALTASGATIANWSDVFYITSAVYVVSAVFYAIFASAELQPWGIVTDVETASVKVDNKLQMEKIRS
ncbi:hypothetical protein JTE90_013936 [Oedothorax gibbosus]|uniref:Sialin n=1 Tax=Oedothorax gibbosus TaxID=931172 RepID=A0AAV6U9E4_9ARAC|nr:hypothetical protein JTE90_013936 [Oedothorax gibbosus]